MHKKINLAENKNMITFICFLITIFGCINWLSIGMLQYDIIAGFFGTQSSMFSRIIYIVIGFACFWLIAMAFKHKGRIHIFKNKLEKEENKKEHSSEHSFSENYNKN